MQYCPLQACLWVRVWGATTGHLPRCWPSSRLLYFGAAIIQSALLARSNRPERHRISGHLLQLTSKCSFVLLGLLAFRRRPAGAEKTREKETNDGCRVTTAAPLRQDHQRTRRHISAVSRSHSHWISGRAELCSANARYTSFANKPPRTHGAAAGEARTARILSVPCYSWGAGPPFDYSSTLEKMPMTAQLMLD